MKIHNPNAILALAVALSLTPAANAQLKIKDESVPPPSSMIGLPGASRYGTDPLHLLQTAKVKQELKLTDEQNSKIAKVSEKYDKEAAAKLGNAQKEGLSEQEIREREDKLIESARKEISGILNADQLNRLKQILLQVNGAEALQDKEVAKEVGITPEESAKLGKLQVQTGEKLRGSFEKSRGGESDANIRGAEKINGQAQQQSLESLTPEQKKKLEKLRGAPFTLERSDVVGH
jgi:Spy/CpxP family protein refolding chaperone